MLFFLNWRVGGKHRSTIRWVDFVWWVGENNEMQIVLTDSTTSTCGSKICQTDLGIDLDTWICLKPSNEPV
jgi:hypothetical protein